MSKWLWEVDWYSGVHSCNESTNRVVRFHVSFLCSQRNKEAEEVNRKLRAGLRKIRKSSSATR